MLKITPLSLLMYFSLLIASYTTILAKETTPLTTIGTYNYQLNSFDFKVSPNPAKNIIKVHFNDNITSDIFIFDGVGNKVLSERINNESTKEISLLSLNSGIYFISIKINDKTVIKRLIKY